MFQDGMTPAIKSKWDEVNFCASAKIVPLC